MKMHDPVTVSIRTGPRDCQEDYCFFSYVKQAKLNGWLLAVFDGHNGRKTAKLCAEELPRLIKTILTDDPEDFLTRIAQQLKSLTLDRLSGSTLSLAFVHGSLFSVSIAIIGDSPIYVLDRNGILYRGPEHNVRSNEKERRLAEQRGGVYQDGYIMTPDGTEGLQLSRSLGDAHLGDIISREAEIFSIPNPRWVLVASDGLFDPGHEKSSEYADAVREQALKHSNAKEIMRWAEARGLEDNATALVWSLGPSPINVGIHFLKYVFGISP